MQLTQQTPLAARSCVRSPYECRAVAPETKRARSVLTSRRQKHGNVLQQGGTSTSEG